MFLIVDTFLLIAIVLKGDDPIVSMAFLKSHLNELSEQNLFVFINYLNITECKRRLSGVVIDVNSPT